MEKNEVLTAQIAAAYYGCNIAQFIDAENGVFGKLVGIEIDRCYALMSDNKTQSWAFYDACKLILKPLEEISEEQIVSAYCAIDMDQWETDFSKETFLRVFSPDQQSNPNDRWGQSIYYEMIDYLRCLGFDMGYGNISSLIQHGLAISTPTK